MASWLSFLKNFHLLLLIWGMPNTSTRQKHGRRTRRRRRADPARNELVSSSLESAQQCLFNQDYGTAFAHYLLVLNLAPVFKDFARVITVYTMLKTSPSALGAKCCPQITSHNYTRRGQILQQASRISWYTAFLKWGSQKTQLLKAIWKKNKRKKCKKHELKYPNQCIQPDLESMVVWDRQWVREVKMKEFRCTCCS